MASNDPTIERDAAIDVARDALAAWRASGLRDDFRTWKEASEIAIKWSRACRLEGSGDSSAEDELDRILTGAPD